MAKFKSVNFLPEVFQTPTNKKFLGSTLDQLIQEPKFKPTQGYIGKQTGLSISENDTYLLEQTKTRADYQFEPGIIFKENNKPVDALTYPGLVEGLAVKGAKVDNHDRLFSADTYSWSPFIDFDKFVNYSQYYWLPNGPDSVDVSATDVFLTNDFNIRRNDVNYTYGIDDFVGVNPAITVVRGGSYNFNTIQTGNGFYIQSQPGADGTLPWSANISSRDVLGVVNNGEDNGTVIFNVPVSSAQEFYHNLTDIGKVDLATDLRFDEVNHRFLRDIEAINAVQNLQSKTIVFLNTEPGDANDLGWKYDALHDTDGYDAETFATTEYLDTNEERYSIFQIDLVYDENNENPYIRLFPIATVSTDEKFQVQYGEVYSNINFYKNAEGYFEQIPLLTASVDTLYYQDANNPDMFGVINVIDPEESVKLFIDDIIGQENYTSPNGIKFTNGLKVQFRGEVEPAEYLDKQYYIEGVGTAIELLLVSDFITPEPYTRTLSEHFDIKGYDTTGYDGSSASPLDPDYITINRASQDLNSWTRSNRWFHTDVIKATAEYNNSVALYDNDFRAKRPIIEFEPNIRLFNYGTISRQAINTIDFNTTDALSNISGKTGHSIDGYTLVNGSRVIFANDSDPNVRNRVYEVALVDLNGDGNNVINLSLAEDSETYENDVILVSHGLTLVGTSYAFVDQQWVLSQEKTSINQSPLFDIFDADGFSISDFDVYSSTTFNGTKLFSYKEGSGLKDPVLGFPLSYLSIDNLGDIVFENNLYLDTFIYVDNLKSTEKLIQDGFVRKYSTRVDFVNEIGWVNSAEVAHVPQVFNFDYDGVSLIMDVFPIIDLSIPAIQILVNSVFVTPSDYVVTFTDESTIVTFNTAYEVGTRIEATIISTDVSSVAYYKVPMNLESNVFNENTQQLTLGIIRNHYNNLAQNIIAIEGDVNGANNVRDLGNIAQYGDTIVQHSAPLSFVAQFIRKNEFNFFDALRFNAQYYEKFKFQLLDWVGRNDIYNLSVTDILENALKDINAGKSNNSSFYQTDMLPQGTDFETVTHLVTAISTDVFSTINVYDFTEANFSAVLVYLNDSLLIKDQDYTVETDGPRITMLVDLEVDDVITFREYNTTLGSSVPNTPTKLGLYKRYTPEKFLDDTYVTPINVIRGHDGSITPAFDDIRDDVLLEFEKRVYNNIKVNVDIPVDAGHIFPGQFRTTDYSDADVTEIISPSFLSWLGWNKIDYKNQDYRLDEERTWNYSKSGNKLDTRTVKGHWRGIYNYFYDTDAPHERPWEMLGFSEKPSWWELRYGPAPYTSGNKVLWDDLEIGLIKEPGNERISERHVRPRLSEVVPVSSEGVLLTPLQVMVTNYTSYDFKRSWKIGDEAPAESAFMKSSAYPFAVQRLLAVAKPAQYFALMVDRDRYTYNAELDQYLYDGRHRIDSRNIEIMSNTKPKHSYVNWIVDYNTHYGYDSIDKLSEELSNADVNLCYRMASFTDKNNLKIFTDKSSPDSANSSLLLPDESFNLVLYKNQPFDEVIYSAITVQQVEDGYAVTGNSITDPYFKIHRSLATGSFKEIVVGRTSRDATRVRIPLTFSDDVIFVPYGFVFSNKHAVVDFISGYAEYLKRQGMLFTNSENGQEVTWNAMSKEFVYWSDQGWADSSIINLNPAADTMEFEKDLVVVDSLLDLAVSDQPQDQNRLPLDYKDYVVDRIDNNFKIRTLNGKSLGYLNFNVTSYEHLLILDNISIFNDLIYNPVTGIRQQRVKIYGSTTYDWTGRLDAPGFMLNDDNIKDWNYSKSYSKGQIIKFKNQYWTAPEIVPPSVEFDFSKWVKIDYNTITKGLIANSATKSDAMLRYYDSHTANLESDADLLSLGLTGFRPRDYLSSLDLDDISQVNIYQDLIQQKGTTPSLNLFKNVNLNNELTNYEIFENWAIKRAEYGATGSRAYAEFRLDESLLQTNPATVEIVMDTADMSTASQAIPLSQIYKESVKHSNVNILPLITDKVTDVNLPYAGFVDRADVDITTFSLEDFTDINNALDIVISGTLIWVAKDNKYDWNVYRCTAVAPEIVKVLDNLDGTLTFEFNGAHNLIKADVIIVKYFDEQIDGTYNVSDIDSALRIRVQGVLEGDQTQISDIGATYVLTSAKLDVPSSISGTFYDSTLFLEDKVWIANDNGKASVYEKLLPFAEMPQIQTEDPLVDAEYGHAIAQGFNNNGAIITDPSHNNNAGIIYTYNKINGTTYQLNEQMPATNTNLGRYGNAVTMGTTWAIVGANETISTHPISSNSTGVAMVINRDRTANTFQEWQVIAMAENIAVAENFGDDVVISDDEKWALISETANNKVHVYQKIEQQEQIKVFQGDGSTQAFYIGDAIEVAAAEQVKVQVNELILPTTHYSLDGESIIIYSAPKGNEEVTISRRTSESAVGDGTTTTFPPLGSLFTATGENISVFVDGAILRPYHDYTTAGSIVSFFDPPADEAVITFKTETYFKYISTIDGADHGALAGDNFGTKLDISSDGSQIIITAPGTEVNGITGAGKVYVFDRIIERFVVSNETQTVYQTLRVGVDSVSQAVHVNSVLLEAELYNANPQYTVNGLFVTIDYPEIAVGDFIDIDINKFELVQTATLETPNPGANFGSSVSMCTSKCSIYVGADHDDYLKPESGSVTRLVNTSRMYGTVVGANADPVLTVNDTIRINRIDVAITNTTVEQLAEDINTLVIPNVRASAQDGKIVIELINKTLSSLVSKLDVQPGEGTAFVDLGLQPYSTGQIFTSPTQVEYGHFGSALQIDQNMNQLIVGAADGTSSKLVSFDNNATLIDGKTTLIVDKFHQSGIVYSYDLLRDETEFSEGKMVFGQQIYDSLGTNISRLPKFGHAVNTVDGLLLVGAPGYDYPLPDAGRVAVFQNATRDLSWNPIRVEQEQVDTTLINSVLVYNSDTEKVVQYLDYIDPLNGKILGVARENIDFITAMDPATYTTSVQGVLWGEAQLGELWWDIQNARFLDYHQEDINYSNRLWGKLFPGSEVEVYQWIESTQTPELYDGEGTPKDIEDFVSISRIGLNNSIETVYYFWVKGISSISTNSSKTLSADAVASYIAAPSTAGIPYVNLITPSTFGLVNFTPLLDEKTSILHIEYDKIKNDAQIFVEFDLIRENNKNDFLSPGLYKKFQDSFVGSDTLGNLVPDVNLSLTERQGVQFRPRQSMFIDRFAALGSYITKVNDLIVQYPVAESKVYPLLNSEDIPPAPNTGHWDTQVNDIEELSYQNLALVPTGHKYLILNDASSGGYWTIKEVTADDDLKLIRVQSYDTKRYWDFADWYAEGFDNLTQVDIVVDSSAELQAIINPADKTVVKVLLNSDNNWELFQSTAGAFERVALENGTIQFSESLYNYNVGRFGFDLEVFDAQYFDQEPIIELRQILKSINEEILTGDLLVQRNKMLVSVFDYILAEQSTVDWLYKTALIDVNHKVRSLLPYSVYQKDNQDYVSDYINEAKPYHCKIKEFLLTYDGFDTMQGRVTDFDCPSYYDVDYEKFISPVLDDGAILVTDPSNRKADDVIWTTTPWGEWYNNRALSFSGVTVTDPGVGYTIVPIVTVIGDSTEEAELEARINGAGGISEVIIINPGAGYTANPIIEFTGGNGSGATALAVTKNSLVRSFTTTIKYDRYEYSSDIIEWIPLLVIEVGDRVRYENKAYEATEASEDETFVAGKYELLEINGDVPLSGVDRIMGFYVADVNNPGLDIGLLINGVSYPGVQIDGVPFSANTGYDSDLGFDAEPFDNVEIGVGGYATYSDTLIDAHYTSNYLDTYLGTQTDDINVEGGNFIDTYHSHAPEELVPGAMFDTLNLEVTSRPGSDFSLNGHAFAINSEIYQVSTAGGDPVVPFVGISDYPITMQIINNSTGVSLYENIDYTINWVDFTVTITSGVVHGEYVKVFIGGIGGGDQLVRERILGSDIIDNEYEIDAKSTDILDTIIFTEGFQLQNYTIVPIDNYTSKVVFSDSFLDTAVITITVLGIKSESRESHYETEMFIVGGADDSRFNQAFFNIDTFYDPSESITNYFMPDGVVDDITTQMNAVVEVNGLRLRTPGGQRYVADGTNTEFNLPVTGEAGLITTLHSGVADNEVEVIIDGERLRVGIDFTISPVLDTALFNDIDSIFNTSFFYEPALDLPRYVILTTAPDADVIVEVYVTTEAEYKFNSDELVFKNGYTVVADDVIAVVTYSDNTETSVLTEVYKGLQEDEPGSGIFLNIFRSSQNIAYPGTEIDPSRLWVTLNGERLNAGDEYEIINDYVKVLVNVQDEDILVITSMSDSIVTDGVKYRLFKDMRGNTAMYSMSDTYETYLTQALSKDDDIIYVSDVSALSQPHLSQNKFGLLMINGERITYRVRDLGTNTVSGLRRGTAGTGVNDHAIGSDIYNLTDTALVPGTIISGSFESSLNEDISIDAGVITSIVGAGTPDEYEEVDIMYIANVHLLSNVMWDLLGQGEILLGNYKITFTERNVLDNTIGGLTIERILRCNTGTVDGNGDPIMEECSWTEYDDYFIKSSPIKNLANDKIWYNSDGVDASDGITLQKQTTIQALFIKS